MFTFGCIPKLGFFIFSPKVTLAYIYYKNSSFVKVSSLASHLCDVMLAHYIFSIGTTVATTREDYFLAFHHRCCDLVAQGMSNFHLNFTGVVFRLQQYLLCGILCLLSSIMCYVEFLFCPSLCFLSFSFQFNLV